MSKNIIKTILTIGLSAGITLIAAFLFYFITIVPGQNKTAEQLKTMNAIMNENLHTVYVAARDLEAGEILDAEDIVENSQYVTDVANLITMEDIGKVVITNISAGSTIHKALVSNIVNSNNEWLVEYSCFRVSPNMAKGSYIDVRIRYQNSEDYVVLSKKQIQNMTETSCYLAMTEEEMQMMASAIVDANLYDAALYTVLYTEPAVQEATKVTYLPNFANPSQYGTLYTEENILLRAELVKRVATSTAIEATNTNNTEFGENIDNTSTVPVQ